MTIESLGLGGVFGEEFAEESVGLLALAACGLKEAAQDTVVLQSLGGAGAVNGFLPLYTHRLRRTITPS